MKSYHSLFLSGPFIRVPPKFHLAEKKIKVLWLKEKFENILKSTFLIFQMNKLRPRGDKGIG